MVSFKLGVTHNPESKEYVKEVEMPSEVDIPLSGMESATEKVKVHPDMAGTARRR